MEFRKIFQFPRENTILGEVDVLIARAEEAKKLILEADEKFGDSELSAKLFAHIENELRKVKIDLENGINSKNVGKMKQLKEILNERISNNQRSFGILEGKDI